MIRIIPGDALEQLRLLPSGSVHMCCTSPPYYGLRDYGMAGQIGLEPTPDEYIAALTLVFREVRRVLRPDGTLWVNIADSYNGAKTGNTNGTGSSGLKRNVRDEAMRQHCLATNKIGAGSDAYFHKPLISHLKPKDLIGIPWALAKALHDPYYTGRIKREIDRVWLAAMIDGEGCMYIHKRGEGLSNGQGYTRLNASFGAGLEIANTSEAVIKRCLEVTGQGSSMRHDKDRRQPLWRWNMRSNECRNIIREVYPYLIAKQHQARLLLGCPSSGPMAAAAHEALIDLHNGRATDVDFPPPASMYEPGFYLRQDLIWSKLNPMPESVQDRCTKSHEYIFLLSKNERYYFDAAAIAEPSAYPGDERHTRNKRSVWTVASQAFPESHFATFPPALIEPAILAGCPRGGVVLDPFAGAGTTGLVADRLGRNATLIELNPAYCAMMRKRILDDAPLFVEFADAAN